MDNKEKRELLLAGAKNLSSTLGVEMFTQIILEERGELSDEQAEKRIQYQSELKSLIRKNVQLAISMED
jgi:hypothetical protein